MLDKKEHTKYKEHAKYINTLMLYDFEVVKLIDIVELDETWGKEWYFLVEKNKNKNNSSSSHLHISVLIGLIPLIDQLSNENYNHLLRKWNLNNQ